MEVDRSGAAHHLPAVAAASVEERFHRPVAGQVEDSAQGRRESADPGTGTGDLMEHESKLLGILDPTEQTQLRALMKKLLSTFE